MSCLALFLLTSHNLDEIEKISDRVGILSDGIIKRLGTPRELKVQAEGGVGLAVRTKPALTAEKIQEIATKLGTSITFVDTKKEYTLLNVTADEEIPTLSKALIESDIKLYEMKVNERSLEDVFMDA